MLYIYRAYVAEHMKASLFSWLALATEPGLEWDVLFWVGSILVQSEQPHVLPVESDTVCAANCCYRSWTVVWGIWLCLRM